MQVNDKDINLAMEKCQITRNGELELLLVNISYLMESLAIKTVLFYRLVDNRVKGKEIDCKPPLWAFIWHIGKPTVCSSPTGIKFSVRKAGVNYG